MTFKEWLNFETDRQEEDMDQDEWDYYYNIFQTSRGNFLSAISPSYDY